MGIRASPSCTLYAMITNFSQTAKLVINEFSISLFAEDKRLFAEKIW
jgi:hypothetical protein